MFKAPEYRWATALLTVSLLAASAKAAESIKREQVQFARGTSSTTVSGAIKGDEIVDFALQAGAGQKLTVTLKGTNGSNYFNVLPPGSTDAAMFNSSLAGQSYAGVLPDDGDYVVRVYLMRAAARRKESSKFTLKLEITGKPLAPIPASKDALIPGTSFHASANISCRPPFQEKAQQCKALVKRRLTAGTATVEIHGANNIKRRILFLNGKPAASDSSDTIRSERKGDITVVKFGNDEWYEIVDAMISGG